MTDGRLPLEGIRVLELASIVAGPFCGALRAEFGAEVIKVAREFEVHQVPSAPLLSMADAFTEPHYQERNMIINVPAPLLGTVPQPGVVPKLLTHPGACHACWSCLRGPYGGHFDRFAPHVTA